jgi:two-component system sensor histidine kinase BarA
MPARILAVDDNPANLRLVSELLKGLGALTETALSGKAALDICSTTDFDLILMDIQMPEMDGLETTRRLREQEDADKRTPIVALTAHAVDEQKTRLLLAGMDDYVGKPVSENELRHVIDRWVSRQKTETGEAAPPISTASTESAAQPLIFDQATALELAKHKVDLARDLFVMLLESLQDIADAVTAAASDEDMSRLQDVVHKLYGGCCYCGVPALRQASADLHSRLHRQQYAGIGDAITSLLARITELLQWASARDVETLFLEVEEL